jgi:hypothetical protein
LPDIRIAFEVLQNNAKLTQKSELMKKLRSQRDGDIDAYASPAIYACDEGIKTQVYGYNYNIATASI